MAPRIGVPALEIERDSHRQVRLEEIRIERERLLVQRHGVGLPAGSVQAAALGDELEWIGRLLARREVRDEKQAEGEGGYGTQGTSVACARLAGLQFAPPHSVRSPEERRALPAATNSP